MKITVNFRLLSGVLIFAWLLIPLQSEARWLTKQESGSVVEKFLIDIQVEKSGAFAQTIDYAVRVQSEDAKTNVSLFNIDYNSFTDKVEILEAYTLNGKVKIPVDKAAIEDRDKGESKEYDAMKVRSVVFPQVQIGSRLFIKYRVTCSKPLLENHWSDQVSLFPSVFVEKFGLKIQSARPLFYSLQDPGGYVKVRQKDPKHLSATNRKDLPGWVTGEKDPYFHPSGSTELWISTDKEWSPFLSGLNADFEKVQMAGVPKPLLSWVKAASKLKTPDEQIIFLMEKMSHDFRYFGDWRRHNGGLIPRDLSEIDKSRYGDCKDLASLLTSMLRALKLDAHVALIRRGDNPWGVEPDYQVPAASRFNHAIVQVEFKSSAPGGSSRRLSRRLWLDATNPVSSLTPFPDISGRAAYVLDPKGAHFERVPPVTPENFEHLHNYEYRFVSTDVVSVKVDALLKGLAPYHLASELMLSPRSEVLNNTLEYFSEGQEVKSYKFITEPKTTRLLKDMKIALNYEAGRVTFNAGKSSFFVIPDGFLGGAFYETADRVSDLKLGEEPFVFNRNRRLKETRLAQDLPAPCRVESPWMTLERNVQVDGHDVVIHQSVTLKRPYIQRLEFRTSAFKKLQEDSKRCFYRSGILIEPFKGALSMRAE